MRGWLLVIVVGSVLGCVPVYPAARPEPSRPDPPLPLGSQFNSTDTGGLRGHVAWRGERPQLEQQLGAVPAGLGQFQFRSFPRPFQPKIQDQRVAEVLVELIGVDPSRSKPIRYPSAKVVLDDAQLTLIWNEQPTSQAVVGVGTTLEVVNTDQLPHNLQGRGADFFALALPPGCAPRSRRLTKPGRVDLRSGLGYFWHAATLQVAQHPYWAVTNARGEFELSEIPPGEYQLRFTLNNWNLKDQGRDPESGLIFRQNYGDPLTITRSVAIERQQTSLVSVSFPD